MTPRRTTSTLALLALFVALAAASGARAELFVGAPVDGPSSAIQALTGLDVSRDGGGGLVELRSDGGSSHVFVSRLVAGAWEPPVRIDPGLSAASAQPVIAAGDGGLLVIAFENAGSLYAVTRPANATAFGAPQLVYGAPSSDPSLGLSVHGKLYIAFTAQGAGGHDVRVAFARVGTPFAVLAAPLDASPGNDAGVGAGRPRVAVAGDGLAVVAWGEANGVYVRRVMGTSPSVVFAQASVPSFQGHPGRGADSPEIGIGDDDSFALVSFHELFGQGSTTVGRALARQLRGSAFEDPVAQDGLAFPVAESAGPARLSVDEFGQGLVVSSLADSHTTWAAVAGTDAAPGPPQRLDIAAGASITYPVASRSVIAGGLVAWQHDGGLAGRRLEARMFDGVTFGGLAVISNGALGSTDAALGIEASGDRLGDVAVAFVQGTGAGRRIVAGGFDRPPGTFGGRTSTRWTPRRRPPLAWGIPSELWGGATYTVTLDGVTIGTTRSTSLFPPNPLSEGVHTWSVVARDRQGQASAMGARTLRIDATAPTVTTRVSAHVRAHGPVLVRLRVRARDRPPPPPPPLPGVPPAAKVPTSGVAAISIDFGDGTPHAHTTSASHRYAKGGVLRLRITVRDRAGNRTLRKLRLRVRK